MIFQTKMKPKFKALVTTPKITARYQLLRFMIAELKSFVVVAYQFHLVIQKKKKKRDSCFGYFICGLTLLYVGASAQKKTH